jgi:hypothetical protein
MGINLPSGFDGVYRCKNHADREPNPISGKLCAECHEAAINAYVEKMIRNDQRDRLEGSASNEGQTTWGEDIKTGRRRVRQRKDSII